MTYSNPPKSGSGAGRMKYLGKGTPKNLQPHLSDHARLVLFAVQQLFQLPANPRKRAEAGSAKVPMWKMKRLLIESFRDLALQDREFAELMGSERASGDNLSAEQPQVSEQRAR